MFTEKLLSNWVVSTTFLYCESGPPVIAVFMCPAYSLMYCPLYSLCFALKPSKLYGASFLTLIKQLMTRLSYLTVMQKNPIAALDKLFPCYLKNKSRCINTSDQLNASSLWTRQLIKIVVLPARILFIKER